MEKGLNKEYAGMTGVPEFVQASVAFAFTHDAPVIVNKNVSTGTGDTHMRHVVVCALKVLVGLCCSSTPAVCCCSNHLGHWSIATGCHLSGEPHSRPTPPHCASVF